MTGLDSTIIDIAGLFLLVRLGLEQLTKLVVLYKKIRVTAKAELPSEQPQLSGQTGSTRELG